MLRHQAHNLPTGRVFEQQIDSAVWPGFNISYSGKIFQQDFCVNYLVSFQNHSVKLSCFQGSDNDIVLPLGECVTYKSA